ncbi:MAG TPA: amidohydrolase family protein [Pyrinomonadaceae bacterium]|nr:amidohydrolase family protein [Pyrinomonadaceae bacterium]
MTILYSARWVLPISSGLIEDGAIAIKGSQITDVGTRASLVGKYPDAIVHQYPDAAILPGLINAHSHLELTAMRGFLESEESDFTGWLNKLTVARLELMTPDDRYVSAAWGAMEAVRAGVTALADASDRAYESMKALSDVGLRGIVFQESFGPDPRLADDNFAKLTAKVARLAELETPLVKAGVSPHAPYTVCGRQLELISEFALVEDLPVMMHAAESVAEEMLLREGQGTFAEALAKRGIEWHAPGLSTIQYLKRHCVLKTKPLLAHCIRVDNADIETLKESEARIAHCPKSNAKLGHGRAPFSIFLDRGIAVGLGSDSVASNNTCDIFEEARFATLMARSEIGERSGQRMLAATDALHAATAGGARTLGLEGHTGELRAGLQADFAVVSFAGPHQLPSYDPINTLIFASSGRDVLLTVVAGREVFSAGTVTTIDEERLAARMKEIAVKLGC